MLPTIVKSNWMPNIFDDLLGNDFWNDRFNYGPSTTRPAVNVIEAEKEYIIEMAAPGLSKKDLKIDLNKNVLSISYEKEEKNEENTENYMRREFCFNSFKRSFSLPESVSADKISAKHEDGILKVHIPKRPEAVEKGPKQISIS